MRPPEKAREISPKKESKDHHSASVPRIHPVIFATKAEKLENVFGKKLFEDLRNERDWKVRLEAIE